MALPLYRIPVTCEDSEAMTRYSAELNRVDRRAYSRSRSTNRTLCCGVSVVEGKSLHALAVKLRIQGHVPLHTATKDAKAGQRVRVGSRANVHGGMIIGAVLWTLNKVVVVGMPALAPESQVPQECR